MPANGGRPAAWHPVPDLADLEPGEVGGFLVAGVVVLACRVGDELFAYRDRCAGLRRVAGRRSAAPIEVGSVGDAVLRCPRCRAHFDVVHAGGERATRCRWPRSTSTRSRC